MTPNKNTARLAGLCFLLMVVFGLFAELFFRQKLFIPGDAAATANNILANPLLYRTGIVSDLLMSVCYLLTALALYRLLAEVHKNLASVMVIFAAAGSVLLLGNMLNEIAPLQLLSSGNTPEAAAAALAYFKLYEHGYMIGQIFFALWVLPLGLLIRRSGFMPKVFGVLFVLETICGLLAVIVHFMAPSQTIETVLLLPGTIAELTFMPYLLIAGIKKQNTPAPVRA